MYCLGRRLGRGVKGGEFVGRPIPQRRVRPKAVVEGSPGVDEHLSVTRRSKDLHVRHFPQEASFVHGIEVLTPDDLVCRLLALATQDTREAVEALRVSLRKPPYSWSGLIERFSQVGLVRTAEALA